jgi:hypothetical protein
MGVTMSYHEGHVNNAASVAHAANRQYCRAIGDMSQPDWGEAPYWQVESARNGIRFAWEHPEATPEDSHASWLAEKLREGWKHGPVKDTAKKEHPCIVPYDQLPEEQKMKDKIFVAIARVMKP